MKTNYFTAVKKPLYYGDNKRKVQDKVAIVREDTKDCIGIVGPDFKIVDDNQLMDHFAGITKKLGLKYNVIKRHELRGGKRTITEVEFPDMNMRVDKKDDILHLRASIINGYDGYSSAKLMFGFYRLVCKNGMVIGKKEMIIGYKHVGEVNTELVKGFELYLHKKIKESKEQISQLVSIKFESENEIESIVEKTPVLGKTYTEHIMIALDKEKHAPRLSAWALYNAYTYVISNIMQINADARLNKLKKLNIASQDWR